jgi:hypothetical protein
VTPWHFNGNSSSRAFDEREIDAVKQNDKKKIQKHRKPKLKRFPVAVMCAAPHSVYGNATG